MPGLGFGSTRRCSRERDADGAGRSLDGLDEFREHMGGRLTIPMIRAPGDRVDIHAMESALVEAALAELKARHRS